MSYRTNNADTLESIRTSVVSFATKLWENKQTRRGLLLLLPLIIFCFIGPTVIPHSPTETSVTDRNEGPSLTHPLGTDNFGRDLLARVALGGQTSLQIGIASALLCLLLGIPAGLIAGVYGGRIDEIIMRTMDVILSFPGLVLGLLILTVLSSNITNAVFAIGIVYTPTIARVVRSSTLSVREQEFVKAAEARGESTAYIMFGEIFPNILGPITVEGTIRVGFAIIIGTSLSFLGLGAQPPTPDWGYMISQSRTIIWQNPWFLIWPSVALSICVIGFNVLGDGLRDVLDVKTEGDNP